MLNKDEEKMYLAFIDNRLACLRDLAASDDPRARLAAKVSIQISDAVARAIVDTIKQGNNPYDVFQATACSIGELLGSTLFALDLPLADPSPLHASMVKLFRAALANKDRKLC
jgi:hypothetical protein